MTGWAEFSSLLQKILMDKAEMSEDSADMVIKTLRKYGTRDVITKFTELAVPPSKDRYYSAGYFDALADLARYTNKDED